MAELTVRTAFAEHRALVRLRVRAADAGKAARAMQLPAEALRWSGADPAALWLAPDQWLLVGETADAAQLIARCETALGGILHNATDATDALACILLEGEGSRGVLAMLSSLDYDRRAFPPGRCARTRMGRIAVIVRALDEHRFELYVERSASEYLEDWLRYAMSDPLHGSIGVRPRIAG